MNKQIEFTDGNKVIFVASSLVVALSVLFCYIGLSTRIIPEFYKHFNAFGTDVPVFTSLIFKIKYYLPLPFFISLFYFKKYMYLGVSAAIYRKKFWRLIMANIAIFISIFLVVIAAMYLPIFMSGNDI
jgi:type II secretory pathway component PulF